MGLGMFWIDGALEIVLLKIGLPYVDGGPLSVNGYGGACWNCLIGYAGNDVIAC